jgi:hypothetical protein
MLQLSLSIDGEPAKLVLHNPPHDWLTQAFLQSWVRRLTRSAGAVPGRRCCAPRDRTSASGGDIVPWPELSPRELRVAFEQRLATVNKVTDPCVIE